MYDAIVISDLHLGNRLCQSRAIYRLLCKIERGRIRTRALVFNGDIFDSGDHRSLTPKHWKVLKKISDLAFGLSDYPALQEVLFTEGNHDGQLLRLLFGDMVLPASHRGWVLGFLPTLPRVFVAHGDKYDKLLTIPWLKRFQEWGYGCLLSLDPSQLLALAARHVGHSLDSNESIEAGALADARAARCAVAICGHTHEHKSIYDEYGVNYVNGGSFVCKPCTFVVVEQGIPAIRVAE